MSPGSGTRRGRARGRLVRGTRVVVLALVLGVVALVVPDSALAPQDAVLVRADPRVTAATLGRGEEGEGGDAGDRTVWILAVGSDMRPGEEMTRTRADAIQLVGMDNRTGAATTIGIPRDSWVPIPGQGSDRINAAMVRGGPSLLAQTVAELVGITPDYVMVTRFPFFENLVDDIGGISVQNPRAFADPDLLPEGFAAGEVRLDGYRAMVFARARKELVGGDFDRAANQQLVLRGIHAEIRERARERGFVERGVLSAVKHLSSDLGPGELFRIAHVVAQVDPARITSCVVPGSIGDVNGASVVFPDVETARRYGDEARDTARIDRC